ncbi:hypothetical protein LK07_28055 [Streptomyces pluripotens]|uniref:Uncharacterized protein n=1 Tax=Streptomyces pluripotens TaxID=1355015 RepID=A0A221P4R8_9ACTN|nr:hypothetical protein LK06_026895 [Streptomyces pluripotens]ASN27249.1 hypothetical protein LK07_28055 [Streptomyces pluripotens]
MTGAVPRLGLTRVATAVLRAVGTARGGVRQSVTGIDNSHTDSVPEGDRAVSPQADGGTADRPMDMREASGGAAGGGREH